MTYLVKALETHIDDKIHFKKDSDTKSLIAFLARFNLILPLGGENVCTL